jgi:peroxiredoxin
LRRWEELRPEFDKRDVRILAICADTPKAIKSGRGKHGLGARILSDRELDVTDRFGLRNQGFHSGMPVGGAKALPVPTSILADAEGKVLWIDQSENYQRRSDPDYVLGALRAHLG